MEMDDDMLDNMAYGQVDSEPETTGCQGQYEAVVDLKQNTSYGSVSSTLLPVEGDYSHTVKDPVPVDSEDIYY